MKVEGTAERNVPPGGWTAMGIFLFFGAAMACFAGATLLWRGTPLDHIWALNARAHTELAASGRWIGIPFLALGAALLVAGIGWFQRRRWGWGLAVAIIGIQAVGDLVNAVRWDLLGGAVGACIAAAIVTWLLNSLVRNAFGSRKRF